jgi:predicted phosphohydrolase
VISLLADSLREAGLDFTIKELDDIAWLAGLLDAAQRPQGDVAAGSPAPAEDNEAHGEDDEAALDLSEGAVPPLPPLPLTPPAASSPLFASETTGTLRGGVLRIRGASGTGAPDQFRRALQPFARRVPSRFRSSLDEEATAAHAADTGIWLPMFRPLRERCFDLSLVVEDCTSAELRGAALADLAHIFRHYSGLRSVMRYRLSGQGNLRLTADTGADVATERLMRTDARHLVLFATDGTSARWRDGSAQKFLHALGDTTSVSILQLLPETAWGRTVIGAPELTMYYARAGEANRRAHLSRPWWIDASDARTSLAIPVMALDTASVAVWARAMSARGGAGMPGVLLAPHAAAVTPAPTPLHPSPVELVARYRQMVSPVAYELAVFLSPIDPLTVPVMRVVQRSMLPNSGDGELAEFILGGLVTLSPAADLAPDSGTEKVYRFRAGVPEELGRALRISEGERIEQQLRAVGRLLESGVNTAAPFAASFPAPDGNIHLSELALPFALVSRQVLHNFVEPPAVVPDTVHRQRTLRILHLTDLHMQARPGPAAVRETEALGEPWRRHLKTIQDHAAIDVVCVSGDLTWSGSAAEFDAAGIFLDSTLRQLGLGRDRLFVVPGNHDVHIEGMESAPSFDEGLAGHAALYAPWDKSRSQANYRQWISRELPHLAVAPGSVFADYQVTLHGWAAPLRIVGLDSSWIPAVNDTLSLTEQQTRAIRTPSPAGMHIALMHHSPDSMHGATEVRHALREAGVGLLLYGHIRGRRDSAMRIRTDGPMVESAAWGMSASSGLPMEMHIIDCVLGEPGSCRVRQLTPVAWVAKEHAWQTRPVQRVASAEADQPVQPNASDEAMSALSAKMNGQPVARCIIVGPRGSGKTALAISFGVTRWRLTQDAVYPYILISVAGEDVTHAYVMARILEQPGHADGYRDAADFLRTTGTLLILDNVDSAAELDLARSVILDLVACPVIMNVQPWQDFALADVAEGLGMATLQLRGLSEREAIDLLVSKAPHCPLSAVKSIVEALDGNPRAIIEAAAFLEHANSTAWLMSMLCGEGDYREATAAIEHLWLKEALERLAFPLFEARMFEWQHASDTAAWRHSPALLAHGPIGGGPDSLGMALTALSDRPSRGPAGATFDKFCQSAVKLLGLQRRGNIIRFTPIMALWLRARAPELATLASARFDRWIDTRLSNRRRWDELHGAPDAVHAWLQDCTREGAALVRDNCVEFAIAHGPLPEWRLFCDRIARQYEAGGPDRVHWLWNCAQLSHAAGSWEVALLESDGVLIEARGLDVDNGVIDRAQRLKRDILERHSKQDHASVYPNAAQPHQQRIADAALDATERALHRRLRAGTVVQALGTGMATSLMAYLSGARRREQLEQLTYLILVDRRDLAVQLAWRYQHWNRDLDVPSIIMPESVAQLRHELPRSQPGILVTTIQKFQHVFDPVGSNCVIICFGLQKSPARFMRLHEQATLIEFSNEASMLRSPSKDSGEHIFSYLRDQAVNDGYLLPVQISRSEFAYNLGPRSTRTHPGLMADVAGSIASELASRWSYSSLKAVLIVDNAFAARIIAGYFSSAGHPIMVTTVIQAGPAESRQRWDGYPPLTPVPSAADRVQHVAQFNESTEGTSLLVTTPGMLMGLHLVGVRIAYVFADLAPAAQLKLESIVNIPSPGTAEPHIVDLANNNWEALKLSGHWTNMA